MDENKIAEGVRLILEGVNEDPRREGLIETPRRVASMFVEILAGTNTDPRIQAGISEEIKEDIIYIKNIPFYSMCEHHLLPFFGKVNIAYIPAGNRVAGFSSITRLVESFSRRLQIQERMTQQIADSLMESLQPQGVLVFVEARQLCVSMRGTNKEMVRTVTQAQRGDFPLERLKLTTVFD